jgi:hypothetical protein
MSKKVHFHFPEDTGVKIYDHIFNSVIQIPLISYLRLSLLQRFSPKFQNIEIHCIDKEIKIDLEIPLVEQGIEPGDRLDIYPVIQKHPRYVDFHKRVLCF